MSYPLMCQECNKQMPAGCVGDFCPDCEGKRIGEKLVEEFKMSEATKRVQCTLCSATVLVPKASIAEKGYCVSCGDKLYDKVKKLEGDIRFMVEKAADESLDGYRELGARTATAEIRAEELEKEKIADQEMANSIIKEHQQRVKELEDEIQAGWDRVNTPCGDALDKLWKAIMSSTYGDWEYPGQAYRHLLCVYNEQNAKIKELENGDKETT